MHAHNRVELKLLTQHKGGKQQPAKLGIGLHTERSRCKKFIWAQSLGFTEQIAQGSTSAHNLFCSRIKFEVKAKSAVPPAPPSHHHHHPPRLIQGYNTLIQMLLAKREREKKNKLTVGFFFPF